MQSKLFQAAVIKQFPFSFALVINPTCICMCTFVGFFIVILYHVVIAELDKLLEDAPLPFIMQHATKISSIRKRVSALNLLLKSIQRRIDNIDRMLSTGVPNGSNDLLNNFCIIFTLSISVNIASVNEIIKFYLQIMCHLI